jgi:hypothetical protein
MTEKSSYTDLVGELRSKILVGKHLSFSSVRPGKFLDKVKERKVASVVN